MWNKYEVEIELVEPLLGSIPKSPEVYSEWLKTKQPKGDEDEPEAIEEKGWTGFYQNEGGIYLMDYQVKGYFKEVAAVMPEVLGLRKRSGDLFSERTIKHRLDGWLFIEPRRIYFGKVKPDGYIERPIRCQTLQGERIALIRSDYVENIRLVFAVVTLANCPIGIEQVGTWLRYGEQKGLGQFRTGGYGRFKLISLRPYKDNASSK